MRRPILALFATSSLTLAAGCSGPAADFPREPVSGSVTLDDQPLDEGMITFVRTDGSEPIASSCFVAGGSYRIDRANGPAPGPHRVTVSSRKPTGKKLKNPDDEGQPIDEMREVIPQKYNLKSELTADVKAGGSNTFKFELKGAIPASKKR